ncbi:MAG: D-cysteine desulfhydrase family protein [Thermotogae bacterium]|nr:D-cysteine desulfhydrase family protein [Thermotogota bacterium]
MKRVNLARLPTPVEYNKRLSAHYGVEIFIKRDDLTEFVGSGNKIRKLEYLMGQALAVKATTVFTCGGVQSNHARATAYVAKRLGLHPVLFLRKTVGDVLQGNRLLDEILGAEVIEVSNEEYEHVEEVYAREKERREARGERVYTIPEGGTNELGIMGYARLIDELEGQMNLDEVTQIYCAVGSVGTALGIALGLSLKSYNIQVVGINVTKRSKEFFFDRARAILAKLKSSGFNVPGVLERLTILDEFSGPDYAVPSHEDLRIIKEAARVGALVLDPVYTAKAFRGMVESAPRTSRILFIHTGGTFGLFPFAELFD